MVLKNKKQIEAFAARLGLTVRVVKPQTSGDRYEFKRGTKLVGQATGRQDAWAWLEEYQQPTIEGASK